jgi:hypothetical protein
MEPTLLGPIEIVSVSGDEEVYYLYILSSKQWDAPEIGDPIQGFSVGIFKSSCRSARIGFH